MDNTNTRGAGFNVCKRLINSKPDSRRKERSTTVISGFNCSICVQASFNSLA